MLKVLSMLTLLTISNTSNACSPRPISLAALNKPTIQRVMSQNGKYLLEMHPAKWSGAYRKIKKVKNSFAVVYSIAADGLMTQSWRIDDIYPMQFKPDATPYQQNQLAHYVSNNGKNIISVMQSLGILGLSKRDLITVYDQSGVQNKLSHSQLTGKFFWSACKKTFLKSHKLLPNNIVELKTYDTTKNTTQSLTEHPAIEWHYSITTNKLKRMN